MGRYDIYSVGCVMYEMLAGKPPFMARSLERVLQMHMYEPVPEIVSDDSTIPPKLIEVIERCLAKNPEDRYPSMNELEAALCEAQIEGKLTTTWDDLPLPPIDEDRRAKLLAGMPLPTIKHGVSGWWLPVLLAFGVAIGSVIAWPMLHNEPSFDPLVTPNDSVVEKYVDHVHEAAAIAYYVYPPVHDPQAATAYKILLELEKIGQRRGAGSRALASHRAGLDARAARQQDVGQAWRRDVCPRLLRAGAHLRRRDRAGPHARRALAWRAAGAAPQGRIRRLHGVRG